MCGRFDTSHITWRELHDALDGLIPVATAPVNLEPNADVRPTTAQATVRLEDGAWVVEKMRWGLVPFWRAGKPLKDTTKGAGDGFKLTTFNARIESVETAATFRDAFARRRCVVPANAWFEWTGPEGQKTKHRFSRADGAMVWFAGLWDRCATPDAGDIRSFTILTGPSAGWLSDYHDRAPMILDSGELQTWCNPGADCRALMGAVRPERFRLDEQA